MHNILPTWEHPSDVPVIPTDVTASVFWITNLKTPGLEIAVGGQFGYWFTLPTHPIGPASTTINKIVMWPKYSPIQLFSNNKAHSTLQDCFFGQGVQPDGTASIFVSQNRHFLFLFLF